MKKMLANPTPEIIRPDILVSILTPTYLRHKFFKQMIRNIELQSFPLKNLEWIIIDDGPIPMSCLIDKYKFREKMANIEYIYLNVKRTIGQKRNIGKSIAKGEFIVHMDDDDWYGPNYVSSLVYCLKNYSYPVVGATTMYYMYVEESKLYKSGPFHKNHCCAGLMGYTREYARLNNFGWDIKNGEEVNFLQNYKIPVIQISNSYMLFIAINHGKNTVDKSKIKREITNIFWFQPIDDAKTKLFYGNMFQKYNQLLLAPSMPTFNTSDILCHWFISTSGLKFIINTTLIFASRAFKLVCYCTLIKFKTD